MNASLHAGVIGLEARLSIARHLASVTHPAVLIGGYGPNPAIRKHVTRTFGEGQWVAMLEKLLGLSIGVAIVTSPDNTHENVTCSLLEAGVAVFPEKPIAITIEGVDRVLGTACRICTLLYVGHNVRHVGMVRTLYRVIQERCIGEVKVIWCRHFVGNRGDYYFKDRHADRSRTTGLLLQEAAHDINVMNWLSDSVPTRAVAMGDLMVCGVLTDRSGQGDGAVMEDWLSFDNWPSETQTGLNPATDVEDLSMLLAHQENGVMVSYEQRHFTPDYWRNYTVIGTRGRIENFGDGEGGSVRVWVHRSGCGPVLGLKIPLCGDAGGHGNADMNTMGEFIHFVVNDDITDTAPLDARETVAAGAIATTSFGGGNVPMDVPRIRPEIAEYFDRNQLR